MSLFTIPTVFTLIQIKKKTITNPIIVFHGRNLFVVLAFTQNLHPFVINCYILCQLHCYLIFLLNN